QQKAPAPALPKPAVAPAQQQSGKLPPLTLQQLQELARQNDPRTAQARAQVAVAQGKRDEVYWASRIPAINATAAVAGPTPEAKLNRAPGHPTSLLDVTPGSRCWFCGELGVGFGINANVVVPVYTFGKITAGRTALENVVAAMSALLQRSSDQATFDVTKAYWGYQTARGAATTIVDVRKRLADAKDRARKLLAERSDQISKSDSMKLDYLAEEIEARNAESEKGATLAFTAIRLIIGKAPEDPLEIVEEKLPDPPPQPDEEQMLRRALDKRPETRAAAAQVGGRLAAVKLERAKLWPDLALVAGGTYNYTTSADTPSTPFAYNPFQQQSIYVALALQGSLDFPQKFARIRQAEAELQDALAQQRGAEQLVRLEVRQALGDLQEARVRAQRYTNESTIGKQLAIQAGLAFDSGLGEARELMEDMLLWARADGERFKALFDAQIASASLQKATGGL
ncbi:MAG TPA: TolC family protein, partial [Myxococcales bacterium]|nr:TolC family protein [Myxococcales bacterium]